MTCDDAGCLTDPPRDLKDSQPTFRRRIKFLTRPTTRQVLRKALLAAEDGEVSRELQDHLAQAGRENRCLCHAAFFMAVLCLLSVAGLGYCAILAPEVFHDPTHLMMRSLCDLGLGSLISQVAFLGYLLWHRASMNRLQGEHRRLLMTLSPPPPRRPSGAHGVRPSLGLR